MDAGAIMQNDTRIENLGAMTQAAREFGVYSGAPSAAPVAPAAPVLPLPETGFGLRGRPQPRIKPGICVPWEEKRREIPEISGDEQLAQRIWEQVEGLGNTFIWQCLLSF
jgi:hypothetical protein